MSSNEESPNVPTGNKGEWGEVYAFFRLLSKPLLRQCDENLRTVTEDVGEGSDEIGIVYFNQILRRPHKDQPPLCYILDEDNNQWRVTSNGISKVVSSVDCDKQAKKLLRDIHGWGKGRTKHFPDAYDFLVNQLLATSIKAKSEDKQDIELTIKEKISGSFMRCGFSIKSLFGSKPTLLNPSRPTCFTYKISGIDIETAYEIQGYSVSTIEYKPVPKGWIPSIVYRIQEKGGALALYSMHETFEKNMEFIDTKMAQMISYYVLEAYAKKPSATMGRGSSRRIKAMTRRISKSNPLGFSERNKDLLYEYKIKRFLEAVALGLTPSTEWCGEEDASGGYIIVKSNGELVAFLIYDRAQLLSYLFNNTQLEHPSFSRLNEHKEEDTGAELGTEKKKKKKEKKEEEKAPSTPIGRIFEKNGNLFITLPLQIRFTL